MSVATLLGASASLAQNPGDVLEQAIPGTELTISMVYVPGGTFELGSPPDESGRDDDEGPARRVRLEAFWMSAHEVTHDQFGPFRDRRLDRPIGGAAEAPFDVDAVTRPSPPYEDPSHGMEKGGHPATGMTRWAALHYARWLSEKTGRLFRLPTEAEWEYACEAGSGTAYGFGDDPAQAVAHAWLDANSGGTYHQVGLKAANAWGLFDMHGNAAEWVMDGYAAEFYRTLPADTAALAPLAGEPGRGQGVVRGGAFDDEPARARCAERLPETPAWKRRDPQIPKSRWWNTDSPHVGFRLVTPGRTYSASEIQAYWAEILGGQ